MHLGRRCWHVSEMNGSPLHIQRSARTQHACTTAPCPKYCRPARQVPQGVPHAAGLHMGLDERWRFARNCAWIQSGQMRRALGQRLWDGRGAGSKERGGGVEGGRHAVAAGRGTNLGLQPIANTRDVQVRSALDHALVSARNLGPDRLQLLCNAKERPLRPRQVLMLPQTPLWLLMKHGRWRGRGQTQLAAKQR